VTSYKSELVRHVKCVHDKIKDKKCLQCKYVTYLSRDLAKHVKGVHNKNKDKKCLQYSVNM
jgi:hypothetical protein